MTKTTWSVRGGRARSVTVAAALAWMALAGAPGAGAQAKVGCLRGQPLPTCRSFWLIEMQGSTALVQTTRLVSWGGDLQAATDAFGEVLEWNLGHMVNLSPTFAVGGVFTLGSGSTDVLTGLRLRGRRWLSEDLSVELEGGLLKTSAGGAAYPGKSGPTVGLRLNVRDQGSFFVRWDGVSLPEVLPTESWMHHDPGGFHHGLSVGASAGSVPALISTSALGLAWTVFFAVYWTDN
ncbi:MAG TPA: hypothetical protein VLH75_17790 [Longimicrobiales bacterium]|nr:hypothetical protein [Longimicrobiales bacterium]